MTNDILGNLNHERCEWVVKNQRTPFICSMSLPTYTQMILDDRRTKNFMDWSGDKVLLLGMSVDINNFQPEIFKFE
jgi:hypothetical protein